MNGMLGRKVEMTQVFDDRGRLIGVTLIKTGPCVVTQVKTPDRDGYSAVQVGLVERSSRTKLSKALKGICDKAGVAPLKVFGEFSVKEGAEAPTLGTQVLCDIFSPGDIVNVTARSKGKGFKGVVRRHRFRGGESSHGSMHHRAPGSIGSSAFPSRVFKGMRMGGHMGNARKTEKNLRIVAVDPENNLLAVCGPVPGGRNSLVRICFGATATKKGG